VATFSQGNPWGVIAIEGAMRHFYQHLLTHGGRIMLCTGGHTHP
jgi:hypothetical protein